MPTSNERKMLSSNEALKELITLVHTPDKVYLIDQLMGFGVFSYSVYEFN